MKTVLIVEDEKMIRQGLRAMVQRSGVPVEMILECNNGEKALELLKEHKVDVMFTDIRMPKMDGIELVQRIQELPERPLAIAVSGYDDFNFAVEMLRNGVRDYLLKPVERQQVIKILMQCEEELKQREQQEMMDLQIGRAQLRHLLLEDISEEEIALLVEKYQAQFFTGGYRVLCASKVFFLDTEEDVLFVDELPSSNLCILAPERFEQIEKEELWKEYAGISRIFHSLGDLRTAYQEAFASRKRAFFLGKTCIGIPEEVHVPEGLRQESLKTVSDTSWNQRIHLIGTEREEELEHSFKEFFFAAEKERITPEKFEKGIETLLSGIKKIYRNTITEDQNEIIEDCRNFYSYTNLEEFREELMALIYDIHNRMIAGNDMGSSQNKIKAAIEYIEQHYHEDLNMAVVSNYVSMNYSLFSYEIKQYTGSNFVDFLKKIRIEQAKKLLQETDLKVIEVSQRVGYDNDKHFMKTFKKVCGISPSEYRKLMQKEMRIL